MPLEAEIEAVPAVSGEIVKSAKNASVRVTMMPPRIASSVAV